MSGNFTTWVGGTHRITDPGVWTPAPPGTGDFGLVPLGHVVVINQTLGDYSIGLNGDFTTSTLDSVNAIINGQVGTLNYVDPNLTFGTGSSSGTAGLLGRTIVNGFLGASGFSYGMVYNSLKVVIADVTSAAGVVIQQALLVNNGVIGAQDQGDQFSISSPSADAVLVNNGTIFYGGTDTISVPITGTGQISFGANRYFGDGLIFDKAVGAGQTVNLWRLNLVLADPLEFRATIAGFEQYAVGFGGIVLAQTVTSALFINHVLTLKNGATVVAELQFTDDITAADLVIKTGRYGTKVYRNAADPAASGAVVPIATTGAPPPPLPPLALPTGVALLPSHGPDITLTSGGKVASIQLLDNYAIHLAGISVGSAPSVNISSVTFGAHFTLDVVAGTNNSFGQLAAVGYNQNNGLIETTRTITATSDGIPTNLAISLSDDVSPTGTVVLAGVFNNLGTIDVANGSTMALTGTADSKLINAGTINVQGVMFIGPAITGNGTINLKLPTAGLVAGPYASLEIGGAVGTGQSIFLQAQTSLQIDDPKAFFATFVEPGRAAVITLNNVDITSLQYNNGALKVNNGADGTLHFHGHYTNDSFHFSGSHLTIS